MKKLILLFTLLSLVALCLFACGNPEESSGEGSSESTSETEKETEWNDPEWTPPVK